MDRKNDRILWLLDVHALLHRLFRKRKDMDDQRLAPRWAYVTGKRPRISRGRQLRRTTQCVEDVAGEAHVNHFLQVNGVDARRRPAVFPGRDREPGVEIGRQRSEFDTDRDLEHVPRVLDRAQWLPLQANHRASKLWRRCCVWAAVLGIG